MYRGASGRKRKNKILKKKNFFINFRESYHVSDVRKVEFRADLVQMRKWTLDLKQYPPKSPSLASFSQIKKKRSGDQPDGWLVKVTCSTAVAPGFAGLDPGHGHGTTCQATLRQRPACHNQRHSQLEYTTMYREALGRRRRREKKDWQRCQLRCQSLKKKVKKNEKASCTEVKNWITIRLQWNSVSPIIIQINVVLGLKQALHKYSVFFLQNYI